MELKKHTCPTCGGQLKIDLERQMYECPFCGVSFDYAYFDEEDVLTRAERFRRNAEWKAADEAYHFMLDKDPHNFCALRGKVLTAARMRGELECDIDNIHNYYSLISESMDQALQATDEAHREYYEKMQEFFDCVEKSRKEKRQLDHVIEKRRNSSNQQESTESLLPLFTFSNLTKIKVYAVLILMEVGFTIGYFAERHNLKNLNLEKKRLFGNTSYNLENIKNSQDGMQFLKVMAIIVAVLIACVTAYILIMKYIEKKKAEKYECEKQQEANELQKETAPYRESIDSLVARYKELIKEIHSLDSLWDV